MIRVRPHETLQTSFNDAIYHHEDILRRIFSILKDPHQSLVCKFWHAINSSWITYKLILEMYNQQEFMTRFTIQLPLQPGEEYISRVKQIFVSVQALVKAAGIECDVKQARMKESLGFLELNPVMKKLEEVALIALFKKLGEIIPEVGDLLNNHNFSLKAETIRAWMQDNSEKLLTVTRLDLSNLGLTFLPPEIGQLINLQRLYLKGNQLTELPPAIGQLINLEVLNLSDNQLTELPLEIGQLINLKMLGLRGNQLSKLPPEIGRLINLNWLYLSGNQLTVLPSAIGQLRNLEELDLASNQLEQLPESINQLAL